ncbi:MAG: ABC transporter ATP-binding protein, partial [Bdellovibrionales bacterium]|nr:ABC transporter ATP-binding protein [Bdellovibrionales bacterium]
MSASVVRVDRLSRSFGELQAVQDVSFSLSKGQIFGLLGPNGSGKSTLIRMMCGVLPPSRGDVYLLGRNVWKNPELIKQSIGYMSQEFSLYSDLTVEENCQFYARIYGLEGKAQLHRIEEILELTHLTNRTQQLAKTLSGGWKQRLALGCALLHDPEILFLDEPTAGIDPVARRELWDLLFDLAAAGKTLFVTTHYMDEAERCGQVGYIQNSHLIAFGQPHEIKALPEVCPVGTKRFEVRLQNPSQALNRLRPIEAVHDATLFGESVHLLTDQSFSKTTL